MDGSPPQPGQGSHSPGGLYNDEGSTNWAMDRNVIVDVPIWLQGCRPGGPWIGFVLCIAEVESEHKVGKAVDKIVDKRVWGNQIVQKIVHKIVQKTVQTTTVWGCVA